MTEDEMNEEEKKGAPVEEAQDGMLGAKPHKHEFCVLNMTTKPLSGKVSWLAGGNEVSIDVNGLKPCAVSARQQFAPMSLKRDQWKWSKRGRAYQLNCKATDRFAVVVISDYGLSVIVSSTSPDTWKW